MIILFHSEECKFCVKLLEYINTNNLKDFFKFIDIDNLNTIPENIKLVPTIIDSNIEAPLEGKKAFEYVVNHKYFNHPTNNVDFWVNSPLPKPQIDEDTKALDKSLLTIYTNIDDVNKLQPKTPISKKIIPIIGKNINKNEINENENENTNKRCLIKPENIKTKIIPITSNMKKNLALQKLKK
jgi:glutaredoxin-related protein